MPLSLPFSAKARRTKDQPISELIATALANPSLINLAAGLVDPLTLPDEYVAGAAAAVLGDVPTARKALQYDTTLGLSALRRAMLSHLEALEGKSAGEMGITPDSLVVTTGSQQALYLVADVMLDEGDIVICASPDYFVYTGALVSLGARLVSVPIDEQGMDVEAVEKTLAALDARGKLQRVKFIYCASYFQNPTGLTLSLERRRRLLDIVQRYSRKHRILILEDAAYRELRYDGESLPSIKSFDAANRHTVLASTFSKPLAPGLKTGYTAMPPDLLHAVLQQKGNHDFGSPALCQYLCHRIVEQGDYARHVERLRQSYRAKRDMMLAALARTLGDVPGVSWTRPGGGLYVWLTLPRHVDASRAGMFDEAVSAGVLYVPGDYCTPADEAGVVPTHHLRLSFGQVDPALIDPGIERLAGVIRARV